MPHPRAKLNRKSALCLTIADKTPSRESDGRSHIPDANGAGQSQIDARAQATTLASDPVLKGRQPCGRWRPRLAPRRIRVRSADRQD